MQKIFFSLWFTLFTLSLYAQVTQKGLVRKFYSNKTPLANVSLVFNNAATTESGIDGKFTLTFTRDKKIGDAIVYRDIILNGYELVNETDLQSLRISSDGKLSTDIILAPEGVIDAAKAEYAGASLKALTAGYQREKKALIAKLDNAKLKEDEYQNQLKTLSDEFEKQKLRLDVLAATFARVNFDDVSPAYKEALELYKQGKLNEAIAILEKQNIAKQVQNVLNEIKRIATVEAKLEEDKRLLADKKKQLIEMLSSLADMYNVNFNPIRAEGLMDTLLILDDKDLSILQKTADFYREQHRYEKAFKIYPKIIAHPQAEKWRKANAHSFLGDLCKTTGNLDKALENYLKFNESYIALYQEDSSSFHKNNLAISYSKLGSTHTSLGNLNKALEFYEIRSKIGKELYDAYPNNVSFKNGLAISYSKLGETHTSLGNLNKALEFYENDLKITKELYDAYPNNVSFKNGLAISYVKLTSFYLKNDSEKAIFYLKEAKKHFDDLVVIAPQNAQFKNYKKIVDDILLQLQPTQKESNRIRQSISGETSNEKRLTLYQAYTQALKTENANAEEITQALNSQAWYSLLTGRFLEAEKLINEGIGLYPQNKFLYTNLPSALLFQGKVNEATALYQKYTKEPFGEQDLPLYKDAFLSDFKEFEAVGIIPEKYKKEVEKIKKMLNEIK